MISSYTLSTLNRLAFGANIDALESYIVDFKQASKVTDLSKYKETYDALYKILEEVKPQSVAFDAKTDLVGTESGPTHSIFARYGNIRLNKAYGLYDKVQLKGIQDKIDRSPDGCEALTSVLNVRGLDIMVAYKHGILIDAFLIGESTKYNDITDLAERILHKRVSAWSNLDLVELRGVVTLKVDKQENIPDRCIETTIMHYLRLGVHLDRLDIVINNILTDDQDDIGESGYNAKLEYLEQLGFSIPSTGILLDITCDMLAESLKGFGEYFGGLSEEDDDSYIDRYSYGFKVYIDKDNGIGGVHCILDDANPETVFEATVKSMVADRYNNNQILTIDRTECNLGLTIDKIQVLDMYDIEKYGINVGQTIHFRVVEGSPVLTD